MYKFNEYVNASDIWPTATNHIDKGEKQGLVRGYNIEIRKHDGTTYWESCCWFDGTPEQYYNSDYYLWHFEDACAEPTGRICFRGYGEEYYDSDEHEYFIKPVKDEEVEQLLMFGSDLTSKENIELFVKNNFPNVKDFEFISTNGEWFEFDSEGYHCKVWKNVENFWYGCMRSLDGNYSADTLFPERKEHKTMANCLIHTKELHDHMTQYFPQEC